VNDVSNTSGVGVLDTPHALAPAAVRRSAPARFFGWLGRTVPSLVVFSTLLGLLAWGHHSGWALPKFSSLTGGAAEGKDDWCEEHSVPESACVECNPGLMPRPQSFGWCKQHGVHDCPLEHPEVAQVAGRAKVSPADFDRARRALDFAERPENSRQCKLHDRRIQFASAAAVEKAGVEVEPVWTAPVVEAVAGSGEITYDPTRTARLSVRVPGSVFRADKQVGDRVRSGEVVALVDAAEVGRAKSEFLHALVQTRLKGRVLDRLRASAANAALPERSLVEAETAFNEARIRFTSAQQALTNLGLPIQLQTLDAVPDDRLADHLRFLGLPKSWADSLDPRTTTGNLLPVVVPFDGIVVSRDVVAGEVVDPAKVLFVVVDVSRLWLTLDLRLEDAQAVKLGQPVRFRPDGSKEEAVGSVAWVSTEADHKTRTIKVRAALDNRAGRLKANTFGAGRVILREEKQAVVVPNGAVQWEGDCHVVFVRDKDFLKVGAPKVFHTRTVRIGVKDDKNTEVIAGVLPGELVAVKGSSALRAELLRGTFGEG
jgi:cobalt-zinc-cadmium efflux system membrane fusion protein